MAKAEELLREGDLQQALEALQNEVRKQPAKAELRTFLFQLLALMGRWDRALTQLNVVGELDAATLAMVQTYRMALTCEALRAEIYAGRRKPLLFGEPDPWVARLLEALQLDGAGRYVEAQRVREAAFEEAPATAGRIDGEPFAWIADCDARLGPVLECVMNGNFYWIPFHRVQRIAVEAPTDLRDFVWIPAEFTWANGGEAVGLIPARYPGTESCADSGLLLARKTEWQEVAPDVFHGVGQRMLATDVNEFPLLDCREIALGPG